MKNIGIIGAGAAGLCALKRSLSVPGWRSVAWEQESIVGGTWVFDAGTGTNKYGYPIHSSMYENLKTNLPKEIMGFMDCPFPEEEDSFIHHTSVLKYLEWYASHWGLREHIKFEHRVESVHLVHQETGPPKWSVTVKNLIENVTEQSEFDFIFICNGHYAVPKLPKIENFNAFKGESLHSHSYRTSSGLEDLKVAVLGAGPSGVDIALEICSVAQKVYLCHDLPDRMQCALPENMLQMKGIKSATETGFILQDGTPIEADLLLYCTGYNYSFPFLDKSCGVTVEDSCVRPLYKHLLHSVYPTMAFPGLPVQVLPFPLFDIQIQYSIKVFLGNIGLPSSQAMEEETKLELTRRCKLGMLPRHFHKLGNFQWDYMDDLIKAGGLKSLPTFMRDVYEAIRLKRKREVCSYKQCRVYIHNSSSFVIKGVDEI